jgi:hypothetical protein
MLGLLQVSAQCRCGSRAAFIRAGTRLDLIEARSQLSVTRHKHEPGF